MLKDTEVTLRAGTLYVVRRVTFDSEDRRASWCTRTPSPAMRQTAHEDVVCCLVRRDRGQKHGEEQRIADVSAETRTAGA